MYSVAGESRPANIRGMKSFGEMTTVANFVPFTLLVVKVRPKTQNLIFWPPEGTGGAEPSCWPFWQGRGYRELNSLQGRRKRQGTCIYTDICDMPVCVYRK